MADSKKTTKPAASARRNQQPITQAELQAVIDLENAADCFRLNIRRRLRAGATVEPGVLAVSEDSDPIEQFKPCGGGYSVGLDVFESGVAAAA